ncbi:MAG: glycosyltransferase family 39 protein [Gallionella sp.]|nr:glycosyltransferase family 39 protein [Gallionella sp.]
MKLSHTKFLILLTLLINAIGMVTPIINAGDSVTYAALSQYIAQHNDWAFLVLDGQEWLDKPHFPFWITALFFKLFGISAFTYILPGFIFHLIGGYYTYRIARLFYGHDVAWLSLLVYVSVFHLMYTSSEVKAETFLTGSITAASYYWLRYDTVSKLKYLLLGALFSAVAMMTKGVFTLITITGGLVCMWIYQKQWSKLWSVKWLLALVLTLVCTAPELLALYLQFDAHPEKVVFGRTDVSGIKFFLWDSQFGRFFNSGPIKNTGGSPTYFVLVFLWAFLPWVAVYVAALVSGVRNFISRSTTERSQFVYLSGAFFVTFALFSATRFQFDYYTVIVYPFAAILCGKFLSEVLATSGGHKKLFAAQIVTTLLVVAMAVGFGIYVGNAVLMAVVMVMLLAATLYGYINRAQMRSNVVLAFPVFGVALLYMFLTLMATTTYLSVSIPYNANKLLANEPGAPIYALQMDIVSRELGLYSASPCYAVEDVAKLPTTGASYYLLVRAAQLGQMSAGLGRVEQIAQGDWVVHKTGMLPRLLQLARDGALLEDIRIVRVTPDQS